MSKRIQSVAALVLMLLVSSATARAQARVINGTVTASSITQPLLVGVKNVGGLPLAGVRVRLRGALLQTTTNAAGEYRIEIPANSSEILTFTLQDYDIREVDVAGLSLVDVVLTSNVRYNQYFVKVDRRPVMGEDRDGILVFESADLSYRFWFDMRVNIDGAVIYGDKLNETGSGVMVRRSRMAMKSQFKKNWYGEVDMDFSESMANMEDAYLMWMPRQNLDIRWGNFKETFSMEQTTSSRYNTFMERAMVTVALAPSRRLGTELRWRPSAFLFAGGVHFQDVGDADVTLASKNNNKDLGTDEGIAFTGKAVFMPWRSVESKGLHFGLAASRRTPMTDDVVGSLRFNSRVATKVNRKKYIDTDYIPKVNHQLVKGAEFAAYSNGFKLSAEGNAVNVLRNDGLPTATFQGAFVQAGAMLFGGKYVYNASEGEFTESRLGRSWGDAELAARFEYLDMNDQKAGIMGGAAEALTLGFTMYPNRNVRFILNWSTVNNDRYASGRQKLFVGHDAKGALTKNPLLVVEPTGKGGEDFKVLAMRIQVSF